MNSKTKAIEILKKFANVEISVMFDLHESTDTFLGDEDTKTVVACALILVDEMISSKVFPSFWREVRDEILNFSPSELKEILN